MRRNHNEFRGGNCPDCEGNLVIDGIAGRVIACQRKWVGWKDYFNFSICDFSVLLIRRYIWYDVEKTTLMIQIFGIKVYCKQGLL